MVFGLSLFSVFVAPFILLIGWLIILMRLRAWLLGIATVGIAVFMLNTSGNTLLVVASNPYLMGILLMMVLLNMLVIGYADDRDRRYLIMANIVFLLMIASLYGWAQYIRRSELYFYQQHDFSNILYQSLISLLSLSVPIIGFVARPTRSRGFGCGLGIIALMIVLSIGLSVGLSR